MIRKLTIVFALLLTSVAFARGIFFNQMTNEDMQRNIAASPVINRANEKTQPPSPPDTEVEVFYKPFNPIFKPDAVENWEYHYKMGEGSRPKWKFTRIAEVVVYLKDRDDPVALASLKKTVRELGGNALVGLRREPVLRKDSMQNAGNGFMTSDILGYMYYGDAVLRAK